MGVWGAARSSNEASSSSRIQGEQLRAASESTGEPHRQCVLQGREEARDACPPTRAVREAGEMPCCVKSTSYCWRSVYRIQGLC